MIALDPEMLLNASGLGSLDARDPAIWDSDVAKHEADPQVSKMPKGNPSLRITGVSFNMRAIFDGVLGSDLTCNIYIEPVLCWQAIGFDTHYEQSTTSAQYRRGVHMSLSYGGTIKVPNPFYVITSIASLFVYVF